MSAAPFTGLLRASGVRPVLEHGSIARQSHLRRDPAAAAGGGGMERRDSVPCYASPAANDGPIIPYGEERP